MQFIAATCRCNLSPRVFRPLDFMTNRRQNKESLDKGLRPRTRRGKHSQGRVSKWGERTKKHPAFSVDRLPVGYEIAKSSSRSMSEAVGKSQKQQVFAFDVCPFEHCRKNYNRSRQSASSLNIVCCMIRIIAENLFLMTKQIPHGRGQAV